MSIATFTASLYNVVYIDILFVLPNDLLLDRQATPLHTPCPGLNFVYFPIPVAQVAPQPVNLIHGLCKNRSTCS